MLNKFVWNNAMSPLGVFTCEVPNDAGNESHCHYNNLGELSVEAEA